MGYDGLSIDVWFTPRFQVRACLGRSAVTAPLSAGDAGLLHQNWTAPCVPVPAPSSAHPHSARKPSPPAHTHANPPHPPTPPQAFIDVAMAAKGPGATELRGPFQEAFEAGFFEAKEDFDKALQVGTPGRLAGGPCAGLGTRPCTRRAPLTRRAAPLLPVTSSPCPIHLPCPAGGGAPGPGDAGPGGGEPGHRGGLHLPRVPRPAGGRRPAAQGAGGGGAGLGWWGLDLGLQVCESKASASGPSTSAATAPRPSPRLANRAPPRRRSCTRACSRCSTFSWTLPRPSTPKTPAGTC